MKNYLYMIAAATLLFAACKKAPDTKGTGDGPQVNIVEVDDEAVFGGKIDFKVSLEDSEALSTLKVTILFDQTEVEQVVIRTAQNGVYEGEIYVPYYKNTPDCEATLRFVGQNIEFGTTTITTPITITRAEPTNITIDGTSMTMVDTDNYTLDISLTQGTASYLVEVIHSPPSG